MKNLFFASLLLLVSVPSLAALPTRALELSFDRSSGQFYTHVDLGGLSVPFVVQGMTEEAAEYLESAQSGLRDGDKLSCTARGSYVRSAASTFNAFSISCVRLGPIAVH